MSPRRLVLADITAIAERIKEAETPAARQTLIKLLFDDLRADIAEGVCPDERLYRDAACRAADRPFE